MLVLVRTLLITVLFIRTDRLSCINICVIIVSWILFFSVTKSVRLVMFVGVVFIFNDSSVLCTM